MANTLTPVLGSNSQTGTPTTASTGSTSSANNLANKNTFLQLMVAQLRYQNPLNPVDGSSFLAQLSQITGVEQMVQMNQNLDAIKGLLTTKTPSAEGTATLPVSSSGPDSHT